MVGVAVNVTDAPLGLGFVPLVMAMETDGVTAAVKVTVMLLLVAVVVVAQVEFDVSTQLTTSLATNDAFE